MFWIKKKKKAITVSGTLTHWDRVKMRFLQTTFIQYNFFNENDRICITISLNLSPGAPFDNIPALVRTVAWYRSGNTPSFEPFRCNSRMHAYITRSHWVKTLCLIYTVSSLDAEPFCLDQTFNKMQITFILATHVYAWTHIMILTSEIKKGICTDSH